MTRAGDVRTRGCGECSPIPHEGGYGKCECECHDEPRAESCGFCTNGIVIVKSMARECPHCDGTGRVQ